MKTISRHRFAGISLTRSIFLSSFMALTVTGWALIDQKESSIALATPLLASRTEKVTENLTLADEVRPVVLELYDREWYPFIIYFPSEYMANYDDCNNNICDLKFVWQLPDGRLNRSVYLRFLVPKNNLTVNQAITEYVEGKNSLFSQNPDWQIQRTSDGPFIYAWQKKLISFSQSNNVQGSILIGEKDGKSFVVIEFYHKDYGDLFRPLVRRMYDSVDFAK